MVPVNIAAIAAALAVLLLYFRRGIPARHDVHQLKRPNDAIRDGTTFSTGWLVLMLLLVGFLGLEPLGVPVSAVAAPARCSYSLLPRMDMSSAPARCFGRHPGTS